MRHRVAGRKLARTSAHRVALRRNLVQSLFEHGEIRTTLPRAKEVRPMAEKLITLAKRGDLHARRRAYALLRDREIFAEVEAGKGDYQYGGRILAKLFDEIGPKFKDRPGGYTRIVKTADYRIGDAGREVVLMLLGQEVVPSGLSAKGASRRVERAAGRQAAAEKAAEVPAEQPPAAETSAPPAAETQPPPQTEPASTEGDKPPV